MTSSVDCCRVNPDFIACDLDAVRKGLVELDPDAADEPVTGGSCKFAAVQGWIAAASQNGVGAPDQPSLSASGRFLSYSADFELADTVASLEPANEVIATQNLFLYDTHLGFTWKLSHEGVPGSALNTQIETECCVAGTNPLYNQDCSASYERRGLCCWQNPCWMAALNSDISGDASSITFLSDFDHTGDDLSIWKLFDVFHYHIPTSTMTRVTANTDFAYGNVYPHISDNG